MTGPRRSYLDHAATTPVRAEALAALVPELARGGNPSSLHAAGRDARRRVEESREEIAAALGAHPGEVILTAGGTEADNLAVKGLFWAHRAADPRRVRVVISAVEHSAVGEAARWLAANDGARVVEVGVDAEGRLDIAALQREIDAHAPEIALISVMWANNEVGTLQPIDAVVAAARPHGIPVHSDAVQAVGHVPVDFAASGLAALSLSGHKLGAPIGVGALLARRGLDLTPVLHGGGQERGVRSGTMNAPGACALAAALTAAVAEVGAGEGARIAALRDVLLAGLVAVDGVRLRGTPPGRQRLPGNAHVTVAGAEAEALAFLLDSAGIEASPGAACHAGVQQASHVLLAMGSSHVEAGSAVRFTLGVTSSPADVEAVLAAWPDVVARARATMSIGVG